MPRAAHRRCKIQLGFCSYHAKCSAALLPDSWQYNIQLSLPTSRSSRCGAGLMLHSQGEVSTFSSTPMALCMPVHSAVEMTSPSTAQIISGQNWNVILDQAEPRVQKRPKDTSAVATFWSEIFEESFHCKYVHFFTCFSLTHTFYRDLAKELFLYSLITARQSQLNLTIMLINTWWLTAKCLHKGIQISICSTIFLTKRKWWKNWSELMISDFQNIFAPSFCSFHWLKHEQVIVSDYFLFHSIASI